jgi:hypothetical protein
MILERGSRARLVSLALNPSLLTGVFFVVLGATLEPPGASRRLAMALGPLFATVLPLGVLLGLRATGRLSDIEMRHRGERELVYLGCLVCYAAGSVALALAGTNWVIWGLMALHVPSTLALAAINRHSKISIHATAIAGLGAAALAIYGLRAWPVLLLLPAAAWGRWASGAHTPGELAGGALLGATLPPLGLSALRALAGG